MTATAEFTPAAGSHRIAAVARDNSTRGRAGQLVAAGGILAALGAAACCVLPFTLFTLGISGAWIGNLTALEPYQPVSATLAVGAIAYGFYLVYRQPKVACEDGSYCASPRSTRVTKTGLWVATFLVIVAIGFPRFAPVFL